MQSRKLLGIQFSVVSRKIREKRKEPKKKKIGNEEILTPLSGRGANPGYMIPPARPVYQLSPGLKPSTSSS